VEERFLLDRIALDAADVAPRHLQGSAFVESNFADACTAGWDGALMTAGVATQTFTWKRFDQLGRCVARAFGQDLLKCGHR